MYFISSGKVDVEVVGQTIHLKPGDFFGEMGLVTGLRRRGDVYAQTYCQLLILKDTDFNSVRRGDRALDAQIEANGKRPPRDEPTSGREIEEYA